MNQISQAIDVAIIGAGPAGLAAALWCSELGLKAMLIERENEAGGQLSLIHGPITNYLGLDVANGDELRKNFLQHIETIDVQRSFGCGVTRADLTAKKIVLSDVESYSPRAIVIATGVRRKRLGVVGEDEFQGRGMLLSGVAEKEKVRGKTVLIVGGGDAAVENALILSEFAEKVILVHRREALSARNEFVEAAERRQNVRVELNRVVTAIGGDERVETVSLSALKTDENIAVAADAVLIRIGVIPNSELFVGQLEVDDRGYIRVDANCMTNCPGVFAIGDVANPASPTISTAVGMAANASKSIIRWLKDDVH